MPLQQILLIPQVMEENIEQTERTIESKNLKRRKTAESNHRINRLKKQLQQSFQRRAMEEEGESPVRCTSLSKAKKQRYLQNSSFGEKSALEHNLKPNMHL